MLSLKGSILLSALFHAGLFALLLFFSGTGGAKVIYHPDYRVRLVRPDEIRALKKKAPPKAKKAPPPKPAKKRPAKKKVKKPPVRKAAKSKPKKQAEVVLPKKMPAKAEPRPPEKKPAKVPEPPKPPPPPPEPTPTPDQILEEALARIEKKAEARAGATARRPAGWEERQKEIQYRAYYDQVERAVRENWIPPQNLDLETSSLMTVVSLTLLPDGRVLKSFIEESSGDPRFDQSVMRAILKSTPFPPPPIGLRQQTFELGLRFHSKPLSPGEK